jgi:hypothetical protein
VPVDVVGLGARRAGEIVVAIGDVEVRAEIGTDVTYVGALVRELAPAGDTNLRSPWLLARRTPAPGSRSVHDPGTAAPMAEAHGQQGERIATGPMSGLGSDSIGMRTAKWIALAVTAAALVVLVIMFLEVVPFSAAIELNCSETEFKRETPGRTGPSVSLSGSVRGSGGDRRCRLRADHVDGLQALRAFLDLELDELVLEQATATLADDLRVVDEDVGPVVLLDEAPALFVVEPLDPTDCHLTPPLPLLQLPQSKSAQRAALSAARSRWSESARLRADASLRDAEAVGQERIVESARIAEFA